MRISVSYSGLVGGKKELFIRTYLTLLYNRETVQDDFWKTNAAVCSLHAVVERVPPAAQSGTIASRGSLARRPGLHPTAGPNSPSRSAPLGWEYGLRPCPPPGSSGAPGLPSQRCDQTASGKH